MMDCPNGVVSFPTGYAERRVGPFIPLSNSYRRGDCERGGDVKGPLAECKGGDSGDVGGGGGCRRRRLKEVEMLCVLGEEEIRRAVVLRAWMSSGNMLRSRSSRFTRLIVRVREAPDIELHVPLKVPVTSWIAVDGYSWPKVAQVSPDEVS